ncbi:MAG TPA: hypothetical protein VGO26_05835, partial [Amnibacterium sp.]|nr:hypothetical protein [Amnibacterium sp.]
MSSPPISSSSDRRAPAGAIRLTDLARAGFDDLSGAAERLRDLAERTGTDAPAVLGLFARPVADPDEALAGLERLLEKAPERVAAAVADPGFGHRLAAVLGASSGLTDFLVRHPDETAVLAHPIPAPPGAEEFLATLLTAVGAE